MQVFTYSSFWRFVYRFGNLIISPLLLLQIVSLACWIDKNLIMLIPFVISILVFYYINKKYFGFYKLVPYKIESDDEKIICSQLLFQKKSLVILYKDIESLTGGIFDGKYRGLMIVIDGKNKISIGFFDKLTDANKLVTILLSKVNKNIYDDVIGKLELLKIKPGTKKQ